MRYRRQVLLRDIKKGARNTGLAVLNFLAAFAEAADEIVLTRKDVYRSLNDHFSLGTGWSDIKAAKQLYNLKRSGYLEFEGVGKQTSIRFTDKAKLRTLETLSDKIEADGTNRYISFDIPEKDKVKRDQFRQALKDLGCQKIQGSLWVTNRNIGKFVEMAAYTFGIEGYVVYIVAEKSDIDGIIEKKFDRSKNDTIKREPRAIHGRKLHRNRCESIRT